MFVSIFVFMLMGASLGKNAYKFTDFIGTCYLEIDDSFISQKSTSPLMGVGYFY